ncbi:MAG: phosphonate C-P lyase system protein PhnH [Burkholderiaceae bacterium]|nr:phosphonate C-P lyase system protein PhnH [Burkholderiaceae bacterium]
MNTNALSTLGAGFSNEALGSQAVFRAVLHALSHPGRWTALEHDAEVPAACQPASAAVLLALVDADCTVWLSPRLAASPAASWLRFHTGCEVVEAPAQARFVWVAAGDALPPLQGLAQGSDTYPDQSATCVVEVAQPAPDTPAAGWRLSGPGIRETQDLQAEGLPPDFADQWAANHAAFPRGVDLVLATGTHIAGLPRSTRLQTLLEN